MIKETPNSEIIYNAIKTIGRFQEAIHNFCNEDLSAAIDVALAVMKEKEITDDDRK